MRDYKKAFVENLKYYMNDAKMTQEKFAAAVGVDQSTVSAWLRGVIEPTLTNFCLIAEYFNCSLDDLVG